MKNQKESVVGENVEKLIFCSDLHGNMTQYQRVFDYAAKVGADFVAFGGDITPKDPGRRTPKLQRQFCEEELFPVIKAFHDKAGIPVLMIMGNDDFISNKHIFDGGQAVYGYTMIDEVPYTSPGGHVFFGYTSIPSTPFIHKCWERRDLESDVGFDMREDTRIEGVYSQEDELVDYSLEIMKDKPAIETQLAEGLKDVDGDKLVLITHGPPHDTVCDVCVTGVHVGSRGIRSVIQSKQPKLTLHGHIHETVDKTGEFQDKIGESLVVTVGNDHRPDAPYIIEANLSDAISVERKALD